MGLQKLVVLDTNVLVSGLLAGEKPTTPSLILTLVANSMLTPCYDARVIAEYREVLARSRLQIGQPAATALLRHIERYGLSVDPLPLDLDLPDPDDLPFYEVARLCLCPLVTGNKKHFPDEAHILSPAEYYHALRE